MEDEPLRRIEFLIESKGKHTISAYCALLDAVAACANDTSRTRIEHISGQDLALKFADLILRLWPMYFKAYKNYCGRDLSKEFFYGDMHLFIHHLRSITDKLTLHCPKIDYSQDVNCNNTMAVLEYKMAEDSFIRDAVRTAMQYSDKYRSQQEETEQKQETK